MSTEGGRRNVRKRFERLSDFFKDMLDEEEADPEHDLVEPFDLNEIGESRSIRVFIAPSGKVYKVLDHDPMAARLWLLAVEEGLAPEPLMWREVESMMEKLTGTNIGGPKDAMIVLGFARASIGRDGASFEVVTPVNRATKRAISRIIEWVEIKTDRPAFRLDINTRLDGLDFEVDEVDALSGDRAVKAFLTRAEFEPTFRGGPGSGHHGHKGRPGEVGGSAPSGEQTDAYDPLGENQWGELWHDPKIRGEMQQRIVDFLSEIEQETGYRLEDVTFTSDAFEFASFVASVDTKDKLNAGWSEEDIAEVYSKATEDSVMNFASRKFDNARMIWINARSNFFPGPSGWEFDFYLLHEVGHEIQYKLDLRDHPFGLFPPESYTERVLGYNDRKKDDEYRSDLFASHFAGPYPDTGERSWGSRSATDDEFGFPRLDPPIPMTDKEQETAQDFIDIVRRYAAQEVIGVERAEDRPDDEPFIIKGPPGGLKEGINQSPEGTDAQVIDAAYLDEIAEQLGLIERGGPGSGHFGHKGRPGKRGGSQPGPGQRISDLIHVPRTPRWNDQRQALQAIESVHSIAEWVRKLPLKESKAWSTSGKYRYVTIEDNDEPLDMMVVVGQQFNRGVVTMVHEIGHWLDHAMLGDPRTFMSEQDFGAPFRKWLVAIAATRTMEDIENFGVQTVDFTWLGRDFRRRYSPQFVHNLRNTTEIFARSYSQYIALRSGNKELNRGIRIQQEHRRLGAAPVVWEWDEFDPVAEAFDEIFREGGWLNE